MDHRINLICKKKLLNYRPHHKNFGGRGGEVHFPRTFLGLGEICVGEIHQKFSSEIKGPTFFVRTRSPIKGIPGGFAVDLSSNFIPLGVRAKPYS